MCQPGNQSIFKECRDKALKQLGKKSATNAELRHIIDANGGCLSGRKLVLVDSKVAIPT